MDRGRERHVLVASLWLAAASVLAIASVAYPSMLLATMDANTTQVYQYQGIFHFRSEATAGGGASLSTSGDPCGKEMMCADTASEECIRCRMTQISSVASIVLGAAAALVFVWQITNGTRGKALTWLAVVCLVLTCVLSSVATILLFVTLDTDPKDGGWAAQGDWVNTYRPGLYLMPASCVLYIAVSVMLLWRHWMGHLT